MNPEKTGKLVYEIIAVLIGGALGSICRFALSRWIQGLTQNQFFPWGIFCVNLLGSFLMGVLFGILVEQLNPGPILRAGIFIGILGGFTTFSSFSMDTITLLYSGAYGVAAIYVIMSVGLCILATALGLSLVRLMG
jgi:CrcB protein